MFSLQDSHLHLIFTHGECSFSTFHLGQSSDLSSSKYVSKDGSGECFELIARSVKLFDYKELNNSVAFSCFKMVLVLAV